MMNLVQQKISRMSKFISGALLVGCVLTAAAALLFVVAMGILWLSDSALSASLQGAFRVLTAKGTVAVPSVETLSLLFPFAVAQMAILFFILRLLRRVFLDFSQSYSPFEEKQVKRLKAVALLTLILAIVGSVFDGAAHAILYGSMAFSIHITWFVLAAVIYCTAYVFDYGCRLQRQSDETL